MPKNIVFIDLETGGLNPAVHQITQIAAIATTDTTALDVVGDPFEVKVALASGHYTQEALDCQNFNMGVWDEEAIGIRDALHKLYEWSEPFGDERVGASSGKTYRAVDVAGYNIEFDRNFLDVTAKRNKTWLPLALWTGGAFDVLQLLKWDVLRNGDGPKNYQLGTACRHRGLVDFHAHDALEDVRATIALARSLLAGF